MDEPLAPSASSGLLRVLGLVFGLAVVVGGVIGSGIMRAPGVVAQGITSAPLILAAWAIGGGVAILSAMPLVEVGSAVPHAGGAYPIARRAFGPTVGFLTGWLSWIQNVAANGFMSAVFAEYVHRLGLAATIPANWVGCGLIVGVGAINFSGTRISGASQALASAIKGGAFMILVGVLFASPRAPVAPAPPLVAITSLGALIMAARVIYQTYAGWDAAIYFSEEVKRPDRNVARATFLGIGGVALLYLLVNAAALHVLTPAVLAGSTLAVGDAAKVAVGPAADTLITALGLFSLAAITNLQIMAASRVSFRMAVDRLLPSGLTAVAKNGAPWASVAATSAGSLIFAATGSYESIVRIYAPWSIGAILMVCLSAIRLRFSEPELHRPWRMPLFPWIAFGAAGIQAALIAVFVWDDPVAGAGSAVVAFLPAMIYAAFSALRRRSRARALINAPGRHESAPGPPS